MISFLAALFAVVMGRVQRIAAPGQWRVWRDDAGLHVEVKL
jgi:hypothetical protein